jgi:hypothetical protein
MIFLPFLESSAVQRHALRADRIITDWAIGRLISEHGEPSDCKCTRIKINQNPWVFDISVELRKLSDEASDLQALMIARRGGRSRRFAECVGDEEKARRSACMRIALHKAGEGASWRAGIWPVTGTVPSC